MTQSNGRTPSLSIASPPQQGDKNNIESIIKDMLDNQPISLTKPAIQIVITRLTTYVEAEKLKLIRQALATVEQKNDVEILNWFDDTIAEIEKGLENKN